MASVEMDSRDLFTTVKNMKVVDKAFDLPFVTSAYDEVLKIAAPVAPTMESSLNSVTPIVEVGIKAFKTSVEESVISRLPEGMSDSIQANMTTAVEHVTAAVEKIDTLACGGIDQLTEKVPQLKETTPELIVNTKESASSFLTTSTNYAASFSLSQVALKMVDAGLDVVEEAFKLTVGSDEGKVWNSIKSFHVSANTIRISGNKAAGTDKAKMIEEASIFGAMAEVFGLNYMLSSFGFKRETNEDTEPANEEYELVENVEECNTPACSKTAHKAAAETEEDTDDTDEDTDEDTD